MEFDRTGLSVSLTFAPPDWARTKLQDPIVSEAVNPGISGDYHHPCPGLAWTAFHNWVTRRSGARDIWLTKFVADIQWWLLLVICGSPLIAGLGVRLSRRRKLSPSLVCRSCGYDLRATPDRCPECGAVPQPPHNSPMNSASSLRSEPRLD